MPQAKPDQVITHRIELQQTERRLLEKYINQQNDGVDNPKLAALKILSRGSSGFFIASGVLLAVPIGIYGYNWFKIQLESALNSVDPAAALDELKEDISAAKIGAKIGLGETGFGGAKDGLGVIGDIYGFFFGDD